MTRALAVTVVLTGEDGQPVVLLPGTVPNPDTAALITNPKAWADAEVAEVEEPAVDDEPEVADSAEDASEAPAEVPEVEAPADDLADEAPADEAPAKSGKRNK